MCSLYLTLLSAMGDSAHDKRVEDTRTDNMAAFCCTMVSAVGTSLSPRSWRQWVLCVVFYGLGVMGIRGAARQRLLQPLEALAQSGSALAGAGQA